MDGYAVNESGAIVMEPYKYLNNLLAMPVVLVMFLVGAVLLVAGRAETESSGGITFDTMIPYAKAGVDFISFGALTHSVKGLDMSFKAAGSDKLIIK